MAVQVYDKKIYVFGGEDLAGGGAPGTVIDATQRYDPATDFWERLEAPPEAVHGIASARIGNKIFLFGGAAIAGSGEGTDLVQQFALPAKKLVRPKRGSAVAQSCSSDMARPFGDGERVPHPDEGGWKEVQEGGDRQHRHGTCSDFRSRLGGDLQIQDPGA